MKKKIKETNYLCLFLIGAFLFLSSWEGNAKEGALFRTQGLINPGGNPKAGFVLINEMRIYLNPSPRSWIIAET